MITSNTNALEYSMQYSHMRRVENEPTSFIRARGSQQREKTPHQTTRFLVSLEPFEILNYAFEDHKHSSTQRNQNENFISFASNAHAFFHQWV